MATDNIRKHAYPRHDADSGITPEVKAILNKIVQPGSGDGEVPNKTKAPSKNVMETISNEIAANINDARAIFEILPDTEMAMQVLVSSILSPKDMISTEINFTSNISGEAAELAAGVIKIISDYFINEFGLRRRLTTILSDALFKTGSYPIAIVPENSLDMVINGDNDVSMESVKGFFSSDNHTVKPLGLLGNSDKSDKSSFGLENIFSKTQPVESYDNFNRYTTVVDNFNALKVPSLLDRARQDAVAHAFESSGVAGVYTGLESSRGEEGENKPTVLKSAYRRRVYTQRSAVQLQTSETLNRESVGHPLVMKLPSEAVIPVHVPSDPSNHVGYYVLLDKNGNPITRSKDAKYFSNLKQKLKKQNQGTSELIEQVRQGIYGEREDISEKSESELVAAYTSLVESDLVSRLEAGIYKDNATLSCPSEVGRIMLARALSKMHTQVLFIPSELMTYVAFDYNDNGTGRSLIEGSKIIASLRAMTMFANTMAGIKNSNNRTKLNITLDEDDPDPSSTVEKIMHNFTKNHQLSYPLGTIDPSDITGYLQRSSVDINVEGHPAYPTTKTNVEDGQRSMVRVDTDLEESLRNRHFMSMHIAPEIVDSTLDVEFATNVVGSNLLLAKRVIIYQDTLCDHLSEFIRKFTNNSPVLMSQIVKLIDESPLKKKLAKGDTDVTDDGTVDTVESIITEIIDSVRLNLPTPDTAKLANQGASFEEFNSLLEAALPAYVDSEMFDGMLDSGLEEGIDGTIAALRSYFQRQWLRKNNIMPELEGMLDSGSAEAFDIVGVHKDHAKSILGPMQKLLRMMRKEGRKAQDNLDADQDELTKASDEKEAIIQQLQDEVDELKSKLEEGDGTSDSGDGGDTDLPEDDLPLEDDLDDETGSETPPSDSEDDLPSI